MKWWTKDQVETESCGSGGITVSDAEEPEHPVLRTRREAVLRHWCRMERGR